MATTRIQYTRDQLREIEKFVVANPKKYLQQKAAPVARPAGSSEVTEQRRASRFERPAGYQGRLGRDRDTETFEEGYQYELASRQNAPPPSSSSLPPPPQSPPPAAVVETKQPEPVAAPLPAVANIGNEFDDLPPVIAPVGTRKSRFTFASTDAPAAPAAPAAQLLKQPAPQPQTVPVYGYQQPVPLPVQTSLQPQYQQRPVAAANQPQAHYYAAAQPVAMPEPPKPQQQPQQRQFVPAPQQYTQPPPAVAQPAAAPLGSFTVQAANAVPTAAKPQHQQYQQHNAPQTASGELDVVAALQRQGVNTNSHLHHQGGRGGGQQQQQQQQRGNGGNAYQQQGRHANHSTVAPPDPAVVSFNASPNQAANSTPPALQALFSASRNAAVPTGVPAGAVVDAAALEAALLGGQRPASGGNNNNNHHHHHGGGGQRGGRRR